MYLYLNVNINKRTGLIVVTIKGNMVLNLELISICGARVVLGIVRRCIDINHNDLKISMLRAYN